MTTMDFYPDANPESSSVDGEASRASTGQSWANIRAGAGTTNDDSLTTLGPYAIYAFSMSANYWAFLQRALLVFNTGGLPEGAVITGASLTLRCTAKANGNSWSNTDAGVALVDSSPNSGTAIAAADYGHTGDIRYSDDITYNGFTAGVDATYTLNEDGLAAINATEGGWTCLGLRFVADLDNTNPAHRLSASTYVTFSSADAGRNKPKLTITYTLAQTVEVEKKSLTVTLKSLTASGAATATVTKKSLVVSGKSLVVSSGRYLDVEPASLAVTTKTLTVQAVRHLKNPVLNKIVLPNISLRICDKDTGREVSSRRYTGKSLKSELYGLKYTFVAPGGPGTLSFKLRRDPGQYWPDLDTDLVMEVYFEGELKWAGDIESIGRNIEKESEFSVDCLGWAAKLKLLGTSADHDYDLDPGEKLSEYLIDHMLADPDLGFMAGDISSDDYEITSGINNIYPGKSWWNIITDGNKFSGFDWWVGPDKKFHLQPKSLVPDYFVRLSDCVKSNLDRDRDGILNWVQYEYSPDGDIKGYVVSEDKDSQAKHGKRCDWKSISWNCTEDEAQQIADIDISLHSKLKPSSSLTTDKIRNRGKVFISPFDVEAGVLQIPDLLPGEENIYEAQAINETSTWAVAELTVNVDDVNVSLSPGGAATTLDTMLARLESERTRQ